jgi:hypothetical protein
MRALVIYESMFGNTRDVADAIGAGLAGELPADVIEVGDAPSAIPDDVALVVVGGPTHAFGMSRPSTRADAATKTDDALVSGGRGVREWLAELESPQHEVRCASFDTHMDKPHVIAQVGSAAGPIGRRLHRLGLRSAGDARHFWVADMKGPLRDGQLEQAREWGRTLGARMPAGTHGA